MFNNWLNVCEILTREDFIVISAQFASFSNVCISQGTVAIYLK